MIFIISIALYIVSLLLATELTNRVFRVPSGKARLFVSWLVGAVLMLCIGLTEWYKITLEIASYFIVVTFIANGAYKEDAMKIKRAVRWSLDLIKVEDDA